MSKEIYYADNQYGDTVNPVEQKYDDTCAIKSQQLILNEYGIDVTEDQLVQYSYEKGWYKGDGSGTTIEDVGNLLEDAGIPCTRQAGANVFNLVSELAQGHRVIVGVDSEELWEGGFLTWLKDFFIGDTPDHALVVAGIDTSDPDNVQVIVRDPGTGDNYKSYPLDQFMDAWSDAQCYMVSTDIPVPDVVPGMENFDYQTGYLSNISGVDYTDFQIYNDLSCGLPVCEESETGDKEFPVSNLISAMRDILSGDMSFSDLFSSFSFDTNVVTQMLQQTFSHNLGNINYDSLVQPQPPTDNDDYSHFLDNSIDHFNSIGDMSSATFCGQQLMMLEYCNANDINFFDSFISTLTT